MLAESVCVDDWVILLAMDVDGAWRGELRADGQLSGGKGNELGDAEIAMSSLGDWRAEVRHIQSDIFTGL